jgi:hypothetical protein
MNSITDRALFVKEKLYCTILLEPTLAAASCINAAKYKSPQHRVPASASTVERRKDEIVLAWEKYFKG